MDIKKHLKVALSEIGEIKPRFSKDDGMFVFDHPSYPTVMHADATAEATKEGYLRALEGFIEARLSGNLSDVAEKMTKGHGGKRSGAGRKPGSTKEPKMRMYIPSDLGLWLQQSPSNIDLMRRVATDRRVQKELMKLPDIHLPLHPEPNKKSNKAAG